MYKREIIGKIVPQDSTGKLLEIGKKFSHRKKKYLCFEEVLYNGKLYKGIGNVELVRKFNKTKPSVGDIIKIIGKKIGEILYIYDFEILQKVHIKNPYKRGKLRKGTLQEKIIKTTKKLRQIKYFLTLKEYEREFRNYLINKEFVEVEPRDLNHFFEGGNLKGSFKFNDKFFLKLSAEIQLRIMTIFYDKVFSISKSYRNLKPNQFILDEFNVLEVLEVGKNIEEMEDFFLEVLGSIVNSINYKNGEQLKELLRNRSFEIYKFDENKSYNDLIVGLIKKSAISTEEIIVLKGIPTHLSPLTKEIPDNDGINYSYVYLYNGAFLGNLIETENDPIKLERQLTIQKDLSQKYYKNKRLSTQLIEVAKLGLPPSSGFSIGIPSLIKSLESLDDIRKIYPLYFTN